MRTNTSEYIYAMARHRCTPIFSGDEETLFEPGGAGLMVRRHRAPVKWDYGNPYTDIIRSILETRRIYSNLTETQFVDMYHKKYKIKKQAVLAVLRRFSDG